MHVLRAEKGYPIIGQDTDGTVTPQDLGMDWIVDAKADSSAPGHTRGRTPREPTGSSSSVCRRSIPGRCSQRVRS